MHDTLEDLVIKVKKTSERVTLSRVRGGRVSGGEKVEGGERDRGHVGTGGGDGFPSLILIKGSEGAYGSSSKAINQRFSIHQFKRGEVKSV